MNANDLQRLKNNGIFSNSNNCSNGHLSVELFLSSPVCWNVDKIESFLQSTFKFVKDKKNNFKAFFVENSEIALPLPLGSDWTHRLGNLDWEIIKVNHSIKQARKRNSSGNSFDTKSTYDLLRCMRNKREHQDEIPEDEREALGWHPNGSFDIHCFIKYWIMKFPKLLLFIWMKFSSLRTNSTFRKFYPQDFDDTLFTTIDWSVDCIIGQLLEKLPTAFELHTHEGHLYKRYDSTGLNQFCTLEFRKMSPKQVTSLLDGYRFTTIAVNPGTPSLTWTGFRDDGSNSNLVYETVMKTPKATTMSILCILIREQDDINLILEVLAVQESLTRVVMFVTDLSHTDKIVNKLREKGANLKERPLKFSEVRRTVNQHISNKEIDIIIQDVGYNLADILPRDEENYELVLSNLQGEQLNQVLRKEMPLRMLYHHEPPPLTREFYIERTFITRRIVTSKILRHRSKDIILVSNISYEDLGKLVNTTEKIFQVEHDEDMTDLVHTKNNRILLVPNRLISYNYKDVFSAITVKAQSRNVHYIKWIENSDDHFRWIHSIGSVSLIGKSLPKKPINITSLSVNEFLTEVETQNLGFICIADMPGTGKSRVLAHLACEIKNNFQNCFVKYVKNMSDLLMNVSSKLNDCGTFEAILEVFSSDPFEQSVLRHLLKLKTPVIRIELLLDAYDEIKENQLELANNLLSYIMKNLPSIRTWVTVRDCWQENIETKFCTLVYKINPLSHQDQVQLLSNYWSTAKCISSSLDTLQPLAEQCIASCCEEVKDLTSIPLHCRMLAEIFQNEVINVKPCFKSITLVELYTRMVDMKVRVLLQEKDGITDLRDGHIRPIKEEQTKCHIYFSLKLLFPNCAIEEFAKDFKMIAGKDNAMKLGLIDTFNPVVFTHRSFAEYFAAVFIHEVLLGEYSNTKYDGFKIDICLKVFEVSALQLTYDSTSSTSFKCPSMKHPEVCYFLDCLIATSENDTVMHDVVLSIVDLANENPFKCEESIIFGLARGNYNATALFILRSLSEEERLKFIEKTNKSHGALLDVILRCSNVEFFKYMVLLLEEWHTSNGNKYEIPLNVFKLALLRGKYEFVKFMVEEKGFGEAKWTELTNSNTNNLSIIHFIVDESRYDSDVVLKDKMKLLEYFHRRNPSLIERKDKKGRTPLLMKIGHKFELKEFLIVQLKADVNVVDNFGDSALHWADFTNYAKAFTPMHYHKLLKCFIDNGFSKINVKNSNKMTPLFCAIKTFKDSLLPETLQVFQLADADFNVKCKEGLTVLEISKRLNLSDKFIESLEQLSVGGS